MKTIEIVRDAFANCPAQAKLDVVTAQIKEAEAQLDKLKEKQLNLIHRLNVEMDGVANKLDKSCPGWRDAVWHAFAKGKIVIPEDT